MFSPYYALARARGRGDPENHSCINVALDGAPRRWAMTERGRGALRRRHDGLAIGASAFHWDGRELTITIDETTVPIPSKLRGRVVVRPRVRGTRRFALDAAGRHRWQPIGPLSDVSVSFERPGLAWSGTGYFDTNDGDEPLEEAFRSWTWSRFDMNDGARIFYDVVGRDGAERSLSLAVTSAGVAEAPRMPYAGMPATRWRIARAVPCEAGHAPQLLRTMVDAPFYARSSLRSTIDGVTAAGVSESLSLRRLVSPAVRLMLPFKMLRRGAAAHGGVG